MTTRPTPQWTPARPQQVLLTDRIRHGRCETHVCVQLLVFSHGDGEHHRVCVGVSDGDFDVGNAQHVGAGSRSPEEVDGRFASAGDLDVGPPDPTVPVPIDFITASLPAKRAANRRPGLA